MLCRQVKQPFHRALDFRFGDPGSSNRANPLAQELAPSGPPLVRVARAARRSTNSSSARLQVLVYPTSVIHVGEEPSERTSYVMPPSEFQAADVPVGTELWLPVSHISTRGPVIGVARLHRP